MIKLEDMVEIVKVKDAGGYSYGYYHNRKPIFGLKLRAKEDSFLERIEIKAKGKFKLENDSENYVQEARIMLVDAIESYYSRKDASEDDDKAKEWIFTYVSNKLEDLARKTKGVSYYDWEKNEFIINQFDYFEHSEASAEMLEDYINNIGESRMNDGRSEFIKWFEDRKYDILTKRQIEYLDNDEPVDYSRQKKNYMKKAIVKKVDKSYHDESIKEYKIEKINNKLEIVQELINCEDIVVTGKMISRLHMSDCCEFIVDKIYEELDMDNCKEFTSILNKNKKINFSMTVKVLKILRLIESELLKDIENVKKLLH